jgi:hypothetical protein
MNDRDYLLRLVDAMRPLNVDDVELFALENDVLAGAKCQRRRRQ